MDKSISYITITKNRGWRGLAEVCCYDKDSKQITSMIFSFSQEVWDDMLKGVIVIQDKDNYYVIHFGNISALPHGHQRSVLIKHFSGKVSEVNKYNKTSWGDAGKDYYPIMNFTRNRNNHTTSDWNYIGIRVIPSI